jgi:amino acid transporter
MAEITVQSSAPEASTTTDGGRRNTLRPAAMGAVAILFFVVATSSPLAVAVGNLPIIIGFGNGVGAPGTYVLAGVVLCLFSVGYTAMSQRITNAGAFYAYVTAGLGRTPGVSAGWVANVAYNLLALFTIGYMGYFASYVFNAELSVNIPWEVFAFGTLVVVTVLGIRGVELNARLLGVFLLCEVSLLLAIDVAVLVQNGFGAFSLSSFSPKEIFSGAPGVAFAFAFLSFIGFEATAIFGEEAKDPRRTVRRATYAAVLFITISYTLTTWAVVASQPAAKVGENALADPGAFVPGIAAANLGGWSSHAVNWLLMTSLFAIMIAIHNMTSRYLFAFGRAGLLPSALGRTHPRYKTPYIAGLTQCTLMVVIVAIFAIAGADPYLDMAAVTGGVGTLGVLALMAATSIAVIAYMRKETTVSLFGRVVAPVLAFAGLVTACVLIVDNFSAITGSDAWLVTHLPWLLVVVAVFGLVAGHFHPGRREIDVFADVDDNVQPEVAG